MFKIIWYLCKSAFYMQYYEHGSLEQKVWEKAWFSNTEAYLQRGIDGKFWWIWPLVLGVFAPWASLYYTLMEKRTDRKFRRFLNREV